MAFISMMLIFLVIWGIILGLFFILGTILLVVGISSKCNPTKAGKKSPIVCIVIGALFMLIPITITGTIWGIGCYSIISTSFAQTKTESVTDK